MNIRKPCMMAQLYKDRKRPVRESSPEFGFMTAVLDGDIPKALSYFRERKLFLDEPCAIDAPYGRFEGLEGIEAFARGFLNTFHAQSGTLNPMFQTIANGRVALEVYIDFVVDGEIEQVPMYIIGDYRTPVLLDEIRIYTHYSFIDGLTPYRKPIFNSAHLEMGDPGLLTGAVRAYYEALHHAPYCSPDAIHRAFAPDCIVGGYDPWGTPMKTPEEMKAASHEFGYFLSTYIPACVGMRYETLIDDGRTCVIEWCHIVSRQGQEERNRIAMSGIAAYERKDEGYICSVRISDYAGHESEIDWDKAPVTREYAYARNLVEAFPKGCGAKPQREYD